MMKTSMLRRTTGLVALILVGLMTQAMASESVALVLTMNGVLIKGENSQTSLGRENTIECLSFESEFFRPTTGGVAVHRPIKILKRIDKSSPLLADAFGKVHTGTAQFKFYRPNPSGDGTTEQFLTVELDGVRISSVRTIVTNVANAQTAHDPPMDEITFSYASYRIVYTNGGIEAVLRVDRP